MMVVKKATDRILQEVMAAHGKAYADELKFNNLSVDVHSAEVRHNC